MEDLTPYQIKELKKSFSIMDENGDGRISAHELLRSARLLGLNPTLQEAEEMIQEVDEDGNGYVDFNEYAKVMSGRLGAVNNELAQMKEAFSVLDPNKDGFITIQELRQVVMMVGERLTEKELNQALKEVEIYPGDKIKYDELAEKLCEGMLVTEECFS